MKKEFENLKERSKEMTLQDQKKATTAIIRKILNEKDENLKLILKRIDTRIISVKVIADPEYFGLVLTKMLNKNLSHTNIDINELDKHVERGIDNLVFDIFKYLG